MGLRLVINISLMPRTLKILLPWNNISKSQKLYKQERLITLLFPFFKASRIMVSLSRKKGLIKSKQILKIFLWKNITPIHLVDQYLFIYFLKIYDVLCGNFQRLFRKETQRISLQLQIKVNFLILAKHR